MKNKKLNKILSICFVLILAGAALVSGTFAMNSGGLAMLTDNGSGDNGSIELIQEQRAGAGFIAYTGNKQLVPVVGSIGIDDKGYPVNTNFVDRFVTVENNSSEDMYIRLLVAMPVAFDNPDIAGGQDPINVVYEGDVISGTAFGNENYWDVPVLAAEKVMCGNTLSNIYSIKYLGPQNSNGVLAKGARAAGYAMYGVFINSAVSNSGDHYTFNGATIDYDISRGLDLKIRAQGIGASAAAGNVDPFSLMSNNPWSGGSNTSASTSVDIQ